MTKSEMQPRSDVFLSYSREDLLFANQLRSELQSAGLTVWMDDSAVPAGVPFLDVIFNGIEGAANILTVLSPDFVASRFCRLEVEHAAPLAKRFVPVVCRFVEPDQLHPMLAEINWVWMTDEEDPEDALTECIAAVRMDLEWVATGARFLQRALDWERGLGQLLDAQSLHQLGGWLSQAERQESPIADSLPRLQRASANAVRRRRQGWGGAGVLAAAIVVGLPGYVILRTPARSWMPAEAAEFEPTEVVVTQRDEGEPHIWLHRWLGELHHPNPYDAGDDVFEDKFGVVELDLTGRIVIDSLNYYVDQYFARARVGGFVPSVAPASRFSLRARFEASQSSASGNELVSLWEAAVTLPNAALHLQSIEAAMQLLPGSLEPPRSAPWMVDLAEIAVELAPPFRIGADVYPRMLKGAELFRLPSGAWLAACQITDGGRYDVGVFFARSEDAGESWTSGPLIPRLAEGAGFFLNVATVTSIVRSLDDRLWLTTTYNLSTEMGHPSGAPGQIAVSTDGGLSWSEAGYGAPINEYLSFTGVAIDSEDPNRLALSVADEHGFGSSPGPVVWLTEDGGQSWRAVDQGLDLSATEVISVLWLGPGPHIVAAIHEGSGMRPVVFRRVSLLERLRGDFGLESSR